MKKKVVTAMAIGIGATFTLLAANSIEANAAEIDDIPVEPNDEEVDEEQAVAVDEAVSTTTTVVENEDGTTTTTYENIYVENTDDYDIVENPEENPEAELISDKIVYTTGAVIQEAYEEEVYHEAVTHEEVVVDEEAYDEVIKREAVTHEETVVDQEAYDELVHHDAITHEETVVDKEAEDVIVETVSDGQTVIAKEIKGNRSGQTTTTIHGDIDAEKFEGKVKTDEGADVNVGKNNTYDEEKWLGVARDIVANDKDDDNIYVVGDTVFGNSATLGTISMNAVLAGYKLGGKDTSNLIFVYTGTGEINLDDVLYDGIKLGAIIAPSATVRTDKAVTTTLIARTVNVKTLNVNSKSAAVINEAIGKTEHHDEVTHTETVIDEPAYEEVIHHDAVTHTETVVDEEGFDKVVEGLSDGTAIIAEMVVGGSYDAGAAQKYIHGGVTAERASGTAKMDEGTSPNWAVYDNKYWDDTAKEIVALDTDNDNIYIIGEIKGGDPSDDLNKILADLVDSDKADNAILVYTGSKTLVMNYHEIGTKNAVFGTLVAPNATVKGNLTSITGSIIAKTVDLTYMQTVGANKEFSNDLVIHHDAVTHTETVVDEEGWYETVTHEAVYGDGTVTYETVWGVKKAPANEQKTPVNPIVQVIEEDEVPAAPTIPDAPAEAPAAPAAPVVVAGGPAAPVVVAAPGAGNVEVAEAEDVVIGEGETPLADGAGLIEEEEEDQLADVELLTLGEEEIPLSVVAETTTVKNWWWIVLLAIATAGGCVFGGKTIKSKADKRK